MRKIFCFIVSTILCISICHPTALAVSVTIHSGGEPGINNLSESEYISDIAESGGWLYFMVTDGETGYQTKIIRSAVRDGENTMIYTPEMVAGSAQLHFTRMEPATSGGLWISLEDGPGLDADMRVVLLQDGHAAVQQQCAGRAHLCAEGAVWKDEAEFICWDGTDLTHYPISAAPDQIGNFVLWNGEVCFEDWNSCRRLLACQPDGQITEIFSLPEDTRFSETSLFTCGGELYFSYRTDAGGAGTIRLSDRKLLSDKFYPVDRVRLQPNGTVHLMVAESITNIVTFTQVSISKDAVTERKVGGYLVKADSMIEESDSDGLPIGWRFTDSAGNQWIYSGGVSQTAAVTKAVKVTADGTTVSYVSEALSGVAFYHKGAGVSFDVEPYITGTGFTMVPVRGAAYLLNADITWDGDSQTVTVKQADHTVLLTVDSMTARVDGAEVSLGTPAAIVDGRTVSCMPTSPTP